MDNINANPDFCPKPVANLINTKHYFVIPSYQRGYRWEEKQVLDLLEDINEFTKQKEENSYYLQPLVVKPLKYMLPDGAEVQAWEVLDGQQRLTTLRLILMYLYTYSLNDAEKRYFNQKGVYDIVYANRPQLNFADPHPEDNIDSYYLYTAKSTIEKWFEDKLLEQVHDRFKNCLLFPTNKLLVKFIWYVVSEDKQEIDSIQVFNRLNKGKISLTSSELIKALFIMDSNIVTDGDRVQADKLSFSWNSIERQFQDNDFWYFISNSNDNYQTRIDMLFDFVTERPSVETDKDYSYRLFQNLYDYCRAQKREDQSFELKQFWIKKGISDMRSAWEYVVKTNDRLVAWFEHSLYYHYVGYLVHVGNSPLDIYNKLSKAKKQFSDREWTLDDTTTEFHKQIMESFKEKDQYLDARAIDGLEYGSIFVFRLLLLFNIESYRIKGLRFDFNSFKNSSWDIEHIDSQNNASLIEHEDRVRWLENVAFILGEESRHKERKTSATQLLAECRPLLEKYKARQRGIEKEYIGFCQKAFEYFSYDTAAVANKDSISNLTLLDSITNREYQDAPFPFKRYRIVEEDKAGKRFMPLCTRNVFLKYYTDSDTESSFIDATRWSRYDAKGYLKAIHDTLDPIFKVVTTNTNKPHEL